MSDVHGSLPEHARAIIAEEEALLARVQATLETARHKALRGPDTRGLVAQLQVLRDDAATASVADLPHLFAQMNQARSLMERQESARLPDAQAPYFAHLRLDGAGGPRDYLLGRTTFADVGAGVRIIDWRFAPVARVFYCYEEGDSYEEYFGERLAEGTVETRRLVVIERGVLTRIICGAMVLERAPGGEWHSVGRDLTALQSGGTGAAARPEFLGTGKGARRIDDAFGVTALLDAEQYEAVSTGPDRPLLVLGSAGSGKTTVALHRLAKIAFDDAQTYPQSRMKLIVPEEGLARLSRRLLAPLGLGGVAVQTRDTWLLAAARQAFDVPGIKLWNDTPPLVSRLKRHPVLRRALAARIGVPKTAAGTTLEKLRKRLADAYFDRRFLESVVEAARGEIPRTAIDETLEHTRLQHATSLAKELKDITDPERLITVDGKAIEEDTPYALAGTVDLDDLPILMFLKAQHGPLGLDRLAHVVLDEAEDFSLFELFVVSRLLGKGKSCTLAGDEMQQTDAGFAGWPSVLNELDIRDAATCRLQVAYRCPQPVVELARRVLGTQAPEAPNHTGRPGAPVGFHHFPDEAQAQLFIGEALRDLVTREPHASVGVIASSPESAQAVYRVVSDMPWARYVSDGEFTFEPGVDITDVGSVKGLEFDYVILPDVTARAWPVDDESRRRLHVAITRTSHQLWVVSSGVRSHLIAPSGAAAPR
ncbi:ATP-binding domain-containing protein [Myxococcus sp. RHSTA-1-4]|uniref:ATP-binding domain-containing protein n=1 Tax=Myxococcus sp. RHSTA-1-4 TaxID=2874601 RepID=UPI001CBB4208|nr:ATP-binding domain-containing protein [Myxococcus sp. RHSTA-1-4]MBZ4416865.1 ATP-binding domain-containing protein [Myxococcus sp. RHSTA-1-4]